MTEVISERTEHRRLDDLRSTAGVMRTTIGNFQHWQDPVDGLWKPSDAAISSGSHDLDGDQFQFRKRSRSTFYAGNLGAVGNKTGVAIQMTNKPAKWIKIQLRGADSVPWVKHDNHTIRFDNVFAGTDAKLFWRAGRRNLKKVIAITSLANLPPYYEIDMQMPAAASIAPIANGWTISHGGDAYRISNAFGWASASITADPEPEDITIDCTTTLERNVVSGGYRNIRIRVTPDSAAVVAAVQSGLRVMFDPDTTIISGAAIEEAVLSENFAQANAGDRGDGYYPAGYFADGVNAAHVVIRATQASFPVGTVVGFRFIAYSDAINTSSGDTWSWYRLTDGADWVEGTQNTAVEVGSCCWESAQYDNPVDILNWPGGENGADGAGDHDATPGLTFDHDDIAQSAYNTFIFPNAWAANWESTARDDNGVVIVPNFAAAASHLFRHRGSLHSTTPSTFEVDIATGAPTHHHYRHMVGGQA